MKTTSFFRLAGLIAALMLSACGTSSDSSSVTGNLDLESFEVLSGDVTQTADSITGTGVLIFPEPVSGDEFDHKITFTLTAADSTLSWVHFADNTLSDGVESKFSVSGVSTQVSVSVNQENGTSPFTLAGDPSAALTYFIEAHNGESPTHLLIFPGELTDSSFLETDALFNSEADAAVPGQGTGGKFFGVRLNNATLTRVVGSEAKFSD